MVNSETDFFSYVDNFSIHDEVISDLIFGKYQQTKITIAIPTFKRAELLKIALESAINQIYYDDYLILVVDNNPVRDDETELLMVQYKKQSNLLYYKNRENVGMTGNWNRMIQLAKSDWIVMLHDDDYLYPNYLNVLSNYLKYDTDLINSKLYRFTNKPQIQIQSHLNSHFMSFREFWRGNPINIAGVCMRREIVLKLGGFNDDFYPTQDSCFWALMAKEKPVLFIDTIISGYRVEENTSFKEIILDGFINNEYYLTSSIMKDTLPKLLIEIIQIERTLRLEKSIQEVFKPDFKNKIFSPNMIILFLSHLMGRIYGKYVKLFY
ncbi:MAG: glycosyltransferase family 2 protein [Mediterranea massiliensis]|nr:glycosyltransferase family 2 protein [Mediterranea massiliensis]